MSKRIFQVILVVIGLIAVITGFWGFIGGANDGTNYVVDTTLPGNVMLDSNLRYFSGMWLGLGLILFWIIPSIERHKVTFRLLVVMIVLGGLGRVLSMLTVGMPDPVFILFAAAEVLLAPALVLWQQRLAPAT